MKESAIFVSGKGAFFFYSRYFFYY